MDGTPGLDTGVPCRPSVTVFRGPHREKLAPSPPWGAWGTGVTKLILVFANWCLLFVPVRGLYRPIYAVVVGAAATGPLVLGGRGMHAVASRCLAP